MTIRPLLEIDRHYPAPIERVWSCLVRQELVARWWCFEGFRLVVHSWNPEPGGPWRVEMIDPGGGSHFVGGVFEAIEQPDRLVHTWNWEASDAPASRVTYLLEATDRGTRLRLEHDGLPTNQAVTEHRRGWTAALGKLTGHLSGGRGPYLVRHELALAAEPAAVWRAITTEAGQASFWTASCDVTVALEGSCSFRFDGGETVFTMRVDSADEPHRLLWTCTDGPPEWRGTTVEWFVRSSKGGGCSVRMTHDGWASADGAMGMCSQTWAEILLRLRDHLDTGEARPYFAG